MWKVQLLGGLAAHSEQRQVTRFRTQKAASLLAYLAYRSSPQPRETLIELLWPEAEIETGRHNLSNALTFLRHLLESQGVPAGAVIVADRFLIGLNPAAVTTDVRLFEAAVQRASLTELSRDQRLALLEEAAVAYRGPLLPGFYEEWIAPESLRLEGLFTQAMIQLSALMIEAAKYEQAAQYAQRAVDTDPLSESAVSSLILALSASAQPTYALRAYRAFAKRLEDDFGIQPSETLQQLVRQMGRAGSPEPTASSPTKGKGLDDPSLRTRTALLDSPGPRPAPRAALLGGEFLLRTANVFFGREEEVRRLGQMLTKPRNRLVTLTGTAGVGKTRLALESAAHLVTIAERQERTPTSAVFVALAEIEDASRLYDAILRALGGIPAVGIDTLDQVAQALDSQPDTLLVLDNFEQLVDQGALHVQQILAKAATVRILVSSRQRLGIDGEQEFHLSALPTSGGRTDPGELLTIPSIALFVDRAQSALADFHLSSRNAGAVSQLCDFLEGLPLSIELAAARVSLLSPARILEQVQANRLDFLAASGRQRVSRQRTLRATLDWSYHLLPEAGQVFLRQMSVFRGGWTLEAAQAICGLDVTETLDLLTLLRDNSLIGVSTNEDGSRFSLLETVREYAIDQLGQSGERNNVCARRYAFFLNLAEEALPNLNGLEPNVWLDRLEIDHDNLRAALAWCAAEPEGAEDGLRLAGALGLFWKVRGHLEEGRAFLDGALARARNAAPTAVRARALTSAGVLAFDQADHEKATALHEESLSISQRLGDRRAIAFELNHLGNVARDQGRDGLAKEWHEAALVIFRELGDERGIATALSSLGIVTEHQNSYEAAAECFLEALSIFRELGDKMEVAWTLFQLGNAARDLGDYTESRRLNEECLHVFEELKDIQGISKSLYNLGFATREQGDFADAKRLFTDCLVICRDLGDKRFIALSLHQLGIVAAIEGRYEDARASFDQSFPFLQAVNDHEGMGWSFLEQANVAVLQGDYETAEKLYDQSQGIWNELDRSLGTGWCLQYRAYMAWARGDVADAEPLYEQALAIFIECGKKPGIGYCLLRLGHIALKRQQYAAARSLYERGMQIWIGMGDKRGTILTLDAFARLALAEGDHGRAVRLWAASEPLIQVTGVEVPPIEQGPHDEYLAAAREALGDAAFDVAWAEGLALTQAQAVALTLPPVTPA